MTGFVDNIEDKTLANSFFREVLFTGRYSQLVVMSLLPKEDIGFEVHQNIDQFFRIEKGHGKIIMNGEEHEIKDGSAIFVPGGTEHNIINTSDKEELKLYTIYSPPEHADKKIHKTKKEAMADEEDHV